MPIVIFDVDGPLTPNLEPEFFIWAKAQPDVRIGRDYSVLLETGDWEAATGLRSEQIHPLFQRFLRTDSHPKNRPTPGSIRVLKQLSAVSGHIATARGEILREKTIGFLNLHFGLFAGYHFGYHFEKAELAKEIRAKYVIDDNHHILRQVAKVSNAQPILFPNRAKRDLTDLKGVTILDAEASVCNDMTIRDFDAICVSAWAEILAILQNIQTPSQHVLA